MKKIIIYIPLFAGLSLGAQNASENYIKITDCLSEDCSRKTETVQYFDFLGRPKQTVYVKATPQSKDLVLPVVYDESGKQTRTYFPIPQSSTANGASYSQSADQVPFPVSDATGFYGGEKIYTENIHEKSPLERILQQKNAGNAWNDKAVVLGYDVNTVADHVKNYTVSAEWNSSEKLYLNQLQPITEYGAATLAKNSATDEDGNTTIEFKNGKGQVVLIRKMLSAVEKADTYYVYNEYGQLAYVIPPLAAVAASISSSTLENLCYQYRYDGRNRLMEKKIPGKGWELMVYDRQNRLILSQDAQLGSTGNNFGAQGWLFTKYDKFGRVAYTGFFANSSNRAALQNSVDTSANTGNNEERNDNSPIIQNGESIYYTQNAFPTGNMTILSVNYYDTYPSLPPGAVLPASISGQAVLKQPGQNAGSKNTRSLPLASYVKNIEDNGWTKNYTYYDEKGRNIGSYSKNHLGGYTRTESELDFAGLVQKTKVYHKRLSSDTEKMVTQTYSYDHQNRLTIHKHQIDSQPEEILAQNSYNEISQLESKKVGGTVLGNGLQTVDYKYNIRGWMTQINDPSNLGSDLFGYEIRYNDRKGLETPDVLDGTLQVKPKFNGNIAEVDWKTSAQENEPLKRYGYVYDGLNRLTAGFYQKTGTEASKEYFEKMEYDLNGNITRLKRSEGILQNGIALQVDNLKYDYTGNRLIKISDEQQNPSGYPYFPTPNGMEYDNNQINGNGNMTKHLDKGISSIQYNYLNLPKQITQNAQVTNYVYRVDGTKVKKLFGDIETNYLDGFQYKSTKPSEAQTGSGPIFTDPNEVAEIKLRIIPTAEGYFDALMNQYIYNYTDHLGNVRLSYSDTNKDGIIQPRQYFVRDCDWLSDPTMPMCIDKWKPGEIVEVNNYYPFGLMHNYTATTQNAYQYKYNGKELQETGMYDYGARFYMPDIGRWGVVDPLAEVLRRHTPYNYGVNNPISFIDPDGRLSISFSGEAAQQAFSAFKASMSTSADPIDYVNENGNKIGTDGTTDEGTVMISNKKDLALIKAAEKSGLHISLNQLNEFTIGMIIPSDTVLKEVVDVKERGDKNGGLREESSSFSGDYILERGPTGPMPVVGTNGRATASGNIPIKKGTHTTIHLHPIGLFVSNGIPYPFDALTPTPGVDDKIFNGVGTNIIVGRLEKGNNSNITPRKGGFNDFRPIGAAIYSGSDTSEPVKILKMRTIENILKRNAK